MTGLNSGDLFPVGLTILSYEAIDYYGNKDTCDIKIVVNDYHTHSYNPHAQVMSQWSMIMMFVEQFWINSILWSVITALII